VLRVVTEAVLSHAVVIASRAPAFTKDLGVTNCHRLHSRACQRPSL
jgi:hypothetical protein